MKLHHLRNIVAVVERGSLRAAGVDTKRVKGWGRIFAV